MPRSPDTGTLAPSGAYSDINLMLQLRFAARDWQLFARKQAASVLAGNVRTRFRGRGIDFEEVRIYQPGDDIRSIDWRVTARTQVPHTKLFREERERPVYLVVDQRSPMFFGSHRCFKSVLAGFIASALAWAALANSDRVGALVFGDRQHRDIRPRRSKHAVLDLIHRLSEYSRLLHSPYPDTEGQDLQHILEDTRRIAKPGSAVFIISDFHDWSSACEEQLFLLARHTDVNLIHCYDSLERVLPQGGNFTITDGSERHQVAGADRQIQQHFKDHFEQRLHRVTQCCQQLAVPLLSFNTDDDTLGRLRELYGKNKRK